MSYPAAVKARALELDDLGYKAGDIHRILASEGFDVPPRTIHSWRKPPTIQRRRNHQEQLTEMLMEFTVGIRGSEDIAKHLAPAMASAYITAIKKPS